MGACSWGTDTRCQCAVSRAECGVDRWRFFHWLVWLHADTKKNAARRQATGLSWQLVAYRGKASALEQVGS